MTRNSPPGRALTPTTDGPTMTADADTTGWGWCWNHLDPRCEGISPTAVVRADGCMTCDRCYARNAGGTIPTTPAAAARTVTLPTTETHKEPGDRRAHWWPRLRGTQGALLIQQGRRAASYVVDEDVGVPFPLRVWHVAKIVDPPARPKHHDVTLSPGGWSCTCEGYVCHRGVYRCQHTDALAALHEAGHLGAGPGDAPPPPEPDPFERAEMEAAAGW